MENSSQQTLIPLEQAMIPFHSSQILAARLPDNRVAGIIHSLCAMLGIQPKPQVQRIRRSKDLAEYLVYAQIETAGGPQRMAVLIAEAIPFWVMRLRIDQIAPEKREFVISLKMEAVEHLYGHFYQGNSGRVARPEPESAHPTGRVPSGSGATPESSWDRLFAALYDLRQEEQAKDEQRMQSQRALAGRVEVVEEWVKSLDGRVVGMGQGRAAEVNWMPLLSGAHLADMRALLRSLEPTTGRTQAQLEQELVETFGVAGINAIPEEQWQDVLEWCWWRSRQGN